MIKEIAIAIGVNFLIFIIFDKVKSYNKKINKMYKNNKKEREVEKNEKQHFD